MPILLRAVKEGKTIAQVLEEVILEKRKEKRIAELKRYLVQYQNSIVNLEAALVQERENVDSVCEYLADLSYFDTTEVKKI